GDHVKIGLGVSAEYLDGGPELLDQLLVAAHGLRQHDHLTCVAGRAEQRVAHAGIGRNEVAAAADHEDLAGRSVVVRQYVETNPEIGEKLIGRGMPQRVARAAWQRMEQDPSTGKLTKP